MARFRVESYCIASIGKVLRVFDGASAQRRRLTATSSARTARSSPWDDQPWERVQNFWKNTISTSMTLPTFMLSDNGRSGAEYGVTDLGPLHEAGHREYVSNDLRYDKKRNYAITFAYVGDAFAGYQRQPGLMTVEQDLRDALSNRKLTVAGRTDRGVSAFSQVVNFQTSKESGLGALDFLQDLQKCQGSQLGRLRVFDCRRVPKKFNARSQATWRRYMYLFPLRDDQDIDIDFLQAVLCPLEGRELPYHAFSYGDCRIGGEGSEDACTLFRARASLVNLNEDSAQGQDRAVLIELVGSRFLRRMVRLLCATALRETTTAIEERRTDAALNILLSRDRSAAAAPLPPHGLALCGVGYDVKELSIYNALPQNAAKLKALDTRVDILLEEKARGTWVE